ncbi:wings apart-like protein 2 [Aristolochia californica]|uniref:wings apart-like protein 2 n=1 Tax=Aristolochia californica TaxID=171875 RepID=UPI0035E27CA7
MIVRTYARRNRCITGSFSESNLNSGVDDGFHDSLPQETSQDVFSFAFSSQDSSPWSFDSDTYDASSSREPESESLLPPRPIGARNSSLGNRIRKSKKSRNVTREPGTLKNPNSGGSKVVKTLFSPPTSTLMEAQEFGEMMEHVDEVNFALDGLRTGQPFRVRRASLVSLLSISMTAQQRRLLRAQGMAKTIIDAILSLSFDDSPSTLAAAALFFVMASDGQDDHLLDSPPCIHFLLKLLNPPTADSVDGRVPNIGGKLLSVCRDPASLRGMTKRLDSSSSAIISKVQEILLSCKEIKPPNGDNDETERPELNSKWIALLTLEKACLSTVSLEDTPGTVRKVGGNFKERLRELGGLDVVFGVAADCHTTMEAQLNHASPSSRDSKADAAFQSVVLLLKCLKIMENATFLSKDNQNHLLELRAKLGSEGSPMSFVGLVISAIKILSGLSLLQRSCCVSSDVKSSSVSNGMNGHVSDAKVNSCGKGEVDEILSNDIIGNCCTTESSSFQMLSKFSQKRQRLSTSRLEISSGSVTSSMFSPDIPFVMKGTDSPPTCMSNPILKGLNGANSISNDSKVDSVGLGEINYGCVENKHVNLEDCQDPFAFDEDDMEPSKWDLLSLRKNASRTQKRKKLDPALDHGCGSHLINNKEESSVDGNICSFENSSSSAIEAEDSNILADCLLTAVKVLMNLANDNSVGCQQIARWGGLDTMANLIIRHFPMFDFGSSSIPTAIFDHLENQHLRDQELDFLVAILGLLVNLVEKDAQNRSRLATASVQVPGSGSEGEADQRDVISLLCTIFLANQGAGEAAGDGKLLPWNDEAALLQGEREAEKMIIEAYAALLLAFLSTESTKVRDAIANYLPDHNLEVLVPVLERFVAFHLTLNMISPEAHATVTKVIESCRGH